VLEVYEFAYILERLDWNDWTGTTGSAALPANL